ncbi:MAG: hypothetical protein HQ579_03910 [Candidatus Omnitrophica bacterium]|nr:hypothetical protein [Candidatus Omnitrophota bacterium]
MRLIPILIAILLLTSNGWCELITIEEITPDIKIVRDTDTNKVYIVDETSSVELKDYDEAEAYEEADTPFDYIPDFLR